MKPFLNSSILVPLGLAAAVVVGLALLRKPQTGTQDGGLGPPAPARSERDRLVQQAQALIAAGERDPRTVNMAQRRELANRLRQIPRDAQGTDESDLARILETPPL